MIEVDGGYLEGGGQIVRTCIALSAITGKPVHIFNIRKGREKPGLKHQHLEGIRAAAQITNAEIEGAELNSTEILFKPKIIRGGDYTIDTKTAGAITLVLQTLIPMCLYAESQINLIVRGGTAVPFSPTVEYLHNVFKFYLEKMGIKIEFKIKRHGFYPRGGGEVVCRIQSQKIKPIEIDKRGELKGIEVKAVSSEHLRNARVGERLIMGFQSVLPKAHFKYQYVPADSPGCFIQAFARYENVVLGAGALGEKGKRAEDVGKDAGREMSSLLESESCVDLWMVDQIIPYMGLATYLHKCPCKVKIEKLTEHARTNIWVTEKFLPVKFELRGDILTTL